MSKDALEKDLNPEQLEAVRHEGGPLLVLAGAGSGKTRVLTHRFARLAGAGGVPPGRILAVTFTNKAAGEMRERIEKLIGPLPYRLWVGTFHSIGVRILRRSGEALGIRSDFAILDAEDQRRLVKAVCREQGLDPSAERVESALATIRRRKGCFPREEGENRRGRRASDGDFLFPFYESALRRLNALDFDDLLAWPVRLFLEREDVLRLHASRFEHVLVDEFQDTNRIQNEMIRLLSSVHGNVCAVGDDDQSIYGWRGADVGNILRFEESFPGARVIRLERNYRSTSAILEAAHAVIRNNRGRRGKKLWTERKGGEPVGLFRLRSEREEGLFIAEDVGARLRAGLGRPGDFAVFYRTNAQSRAIEDAFRALAIPYTIVGGTRFYERKEVKDVLAYLRLLVNRRDDLSFERVLNVPPRGIGERTRERLKAFAAAHGLPLLDACERAGAIDGLAKRGADLLEEFARRLARFRRRSEEAAPHVAAREIVEELGLDAMHEEKDELRGEARAENVREFISAIADYEARNPEGTLADFLGEVSLLTDLDSWEESRDAVTLMTLHNSKGLEFRRVYIAGVEEGLLPHLLSTERDEHVEEERRLFYVGLTRAKDRVTLTHASSRLRFGEIAPCSSSRFLEEIPSHMIDGHRLAGKGSARARTNRSDRDTSEEVFPEYENESQEAVPFRAGDRIRHAVWGEGRVTGVQGCGADTKLTIRFAPGFSKKILVRFASIERIGR
ncbi:MAG: UvrD-helicase domain-containing protein [Candidatus Eisenbacteria bacterium]|nr:UvrD-helicase domain-containing protein [Candidatus Eisenbacteria bacterium]